MLCLLSANGWPPSAAPCAPPGVAAYLIPTGDPHSSEYLPAHYNSREYFSGFTGENSTLVVTLTKSALWADGRFFVQAEKELAGTEIELMRMGEPGVPTVEQYCADALQEGEKLGLCGLTASCQLVRGLQKVLDPKGVAVCTLNLEDELWTENRPPLPATPRLAAARRLRRGHPRRKAGPPAGQTGRAGLHRPDGGQAGQPGLAAQPACHGHRVHSLRHGLLLCDPDGGRPLPQQRAAGPRGRRRAGRLRRPAGGLQRRPVLHRRVQRAPDRPGGAPPR